MRLSLLALIAASAFAQCTPVSQAGCPVNFLTSSTLLTGSAYGNAPTGVWVRGAQAYNGAVALDNFDIAWPDGIGTGAGVYRIHGLHGGGFGQFTPTTKGQTCYGGSQTQTGCIVSIVQMCGCVVIFADYQIFPAKTAPTIEQDMDCLMSYLAANCATDATPGNCMDNRTFGQSAGGWAILKMQWAKGTVTRSCATGAGTWAVTRMAPVSAMISGAYGGVAGASSGYAHGDVGFVGAVNGYLPCSSLATCLTADLAGNFSPMLQITQGNVAQLNVPTLFVAGAGDVTMVEPFHIGTAIPLLSALSPSLNYNWYTGPPNCINCGGHTSDLGSAGFPGGSNPGYALNRVIQFLMNQGPASVPAGGVAY